MEYLKTFDNGLRLILKKIDGLLSVTAGVLVNTASRNETDENNGISHFIEHMLFKGTKKRTAFEISDSIDRIGAQINAFTSKEITCYYTKSTTEHIEKSIDILSDIFFNSLFDETEMQKEKGVILEEISMVEDTPDDVCFDMLAKAFYGERSLGRPILGSRENIQNFKRQDIIDYMQKQYSPENIVISIAGNIGEKEAEELVEKYFFKNFKGEQKSTEYFIEKFEVIDRTFVKKFKDIEQSHLALAFETFKLGDKRINELSIINAVLGGGMSSRLFQKIREELGLAYSVYSFPSSYDDNGIFTIYAGVNPQNAKLTIETIANELKILRAEGLKEDEFLRGKEQIKGAFVFAQESTSSQMMLYGKNLMLTNKIFSFEDKIKDINAVTLDKVNEICEAYFKLENFGSCYIGKEIKDFDIGKIVRAANN